MKIQLIGCLLLCSCTGLYGQESGVQDIPVKMLTYQNLENDSVLRRFEVRFTQMDSLMKGARHITVLPEIHEKVAVYQSLDSLYQLKAKDEIAAFKRKNGLEVTGQIYQRLDNTVGLDEDDQYSSYSTKFQGELGWNFFNSAFLQKGQQIRSIRLANELASVQAQKQVSVEQWGILEQEIRQTYDKYIAIILYHRLMNTDILNMAYQYALEQDRMANSKLLDVMNDKMDIEYALLQSCSIDSVRNEPLFLPEVRIMRLDTASIWRNLDKQNPDLRASLIKEDLLDAKIKLTNYAHEMRFTPFIRASHYLRSMLPSSTNIDLGVRFTFPLFDSSAKTRNALRTEQTIEVLGRKNICNEARQNCDHLLVQFERLNETIRAEKYHLEQMDRFIDMRKEAYLNSTGGYNYIDRMEEYNSFLKSVERLYRLMLARDLCMLNIWKALGYMELPVIANNN